MHTKLFLVAIAVISLSACSTVVNGKNQSLALNTDGVEGADCKLTGGSKFAVKESFTSPASVQVPRSKKPLQLSCSKVGYQEASRSINSKVEATTGGNLLIGGFIGAGVDAATGAIYKYPETISLPMIKMGVTTTATGEPVS